MDGRIVVKVALDRDAQVWLVESSGLAGLNVEAAALEEMFEKLPAAVADLIECEDDGPDYDLPIELIAHASTRARARKSTQ